jgi:putative transposase
MSKTTTSRQNTPVSNELDPEVIAFRRQFDDRSPLDEIVREGARKMLQAAIDTEVDAFIETHQDRRDEQGRRLVVRNGSLPAREILTGAGAIAVKQGRVRDNSPDASQRVQFSPSVLPAYLRRTDAIEELIPGCTSKASRRATSATRCKQSSASGPRA